jgi:hypothetical protein
MTNFIPDILHKYYEDAQGIENKMDGARSVHREDDKWIQNFSRKPQGSKPLGGWRNWEDNI